MKLKLTSLTLLFVLAAPLVIPYCWLQYERSVVKDDVESRIVKGIDKDDLVVLKFSREESLTMVRWEDQGEFEYNRQMFDIVDTRIEGDTIYYTCWWDKEETLIVRQLSDLRSKSLNSDPQRKLTRERLFSYYKTLYTPVKFDWTTLMQGNMNEYDGFYAVSFSSFSSPPPGPPPKAG